MPRLLDRKHLGTLLSAGLTGGRIAMLWSNVYGHLEKSDILKMGGAG